MAYQNKNTMWFFVRSLVVMAVVLLPFFYTGQALMNKQFINPWIESIVDTVFAPTVWFFNAACSSMQYCITSQYSGADLMVPIYIVSVILYGYAISLIWRWVSVPKTYGRRRYVEYDEHDRGF